MDIPRIGVGVPSVGPHASPEAIVAVATAADGLGFHSVSTFERLLLPATPGWRNIYGLPEYPVYDALETLTWVAAHTQRIRLGTSIVVSLFQPPIVLARRLATLDRLSNGRLDVGIAQGWMPEEFTAAGVPLAHRGAGFEEHLAAMRACWAPDPVEHEGPRYRIPRSKVGPKPVNGHLPVLVGGTSRRAVERAARLADGFVTAFQDWDTTRAQIGWYRGAGGGGPVVLRVNPGRIDTDDPTAPFTGTAPSVMDDLGRAATAGVNEVIWDLNIRGVNPRRQSSHRKPERSGTAGYRDALALTTWSQRVRAPKHKASIPREISTAEAVAEPMESFFDVVCRNRAKS